MKYTILFFLFLSFFAVSAASLAEEKKPAAKVTGVQIDTDGDKAISAQESKVFAEKQFSLYDRDKDGSFDMKAYRIPFDALAKAKKLDPKNKANDEKAIAESFARMDGNKDSKISKEEFLKDAELRHKTMDGNGDGKVTPAEMVALQKKIKSAHEKTKE